MNISAQKIISVLCKVAFIAAIICSTVYLLMLGWYNHLLLDDYGDAVCVKQYGAWELMRNAYFSLQSRFSGFLVLGWILKIWGYASNLIGYTILLLALGYIVVYYALRNMTQVNDKWWLLGSAMLFTNVSVMAYLEMSTFYWLCCALYTLATYAAISLFTAIFFSKGKEWARWLVIVVCSIYISGGAENFTPIIIAILGIILLYRLIKKRDWKILLEKQTLMILVSLVLLCAGFIAVIAGPGTKARATEGELQGFMDGFALLPFVTQLVKASTVFYMRLLSRSLYYVLLFPLGMYIGMKEAMHYNEEPSIAWKNVLLSALVALFAIELSIAASVYGVGWYTSLRAYSFVSFIIMAMVVYRGVVFGCRFVTHRMVVNAVLAVSCIIVTSISIYFYQKERPMAAEVHYQVEMRKELILKHKLANDKSPLIIEELNYPHIPNSYKIMRYGLCKVIGLQFKEVADPAEYFPYERYCLSINPSDWRNEDMKRYFDVDYDIVGWSEE